MAVWLQESPFPESVERRKKMIAAALAYNDMWVKFNAAPADLIVDQNVHVVRILLFSLPLFACACCPKWCE